MNLISREELHRKLEHGEDFKLVMTLPGFAYSTKHIPGSLHFETVEEAIAALDREDEIVVYCAGVHCVASIYAYRLLESKGFTRVRRYAAGLADWEEAGYPLEDDPRDYGEPQPRTTRDRPGRNRPCYLCP